MAHRAIGPGHRPVLGPGIYSQALGPVLGPVLCPFPGQSSLRAPGRRGPRPSIWPGTLPHRAIGPVLGPTGPWPGIRAWNRQPGPRPGTWPGGPTGPRPLVQNRAWNREPGPRPGGRPSTRPSTRWPHRAQAIGQSLASSWPGIRAWNRQPGPRPSTRWPQGLGQVPAPQGHGPLASLRPGGWPL